MQRIHIRKELTGKILDIGGGGEGVIGRVYGAQVTAIDISPEELAEAPEGFEKLVMDAKRLSFPDNFFDHVTAFYSFLFIPKADHKQVISEIARVLCPGGALRIWDCEVSSAYPEPFTAELDIDAGGEAIHTTYGILEQDCVQTAKGLIALCEQENLRLTQKQCTENGFFLRFEKVRYAGAVVFAEKPEAAAAGQICPVCSDKSGDRLMSHKKNRKRDQQQ